MTTYKEIHGTNIKVLSSDPANPVAGQIWYNTSTNLVKAFLINAGSWASAPNIAVNRAYLGGCGTSSSALLFGGGDNQVTTQSWNNTAWTSVNALNVGRRKGGSAGSSNTNALYFGGYTQDGPARRLNNVESFNGSWTAQNVMPSIRFQQGGSGTSTAALSFGGEGAGSADTVSLSYNGSWTSTPSMNTARSNIGGWGTYTSAIAAGGRLGDGAGSTSNKTESYNGSAWTTVANLTSARYYAGMAQSGGANNGSGYVAGGNDAIPSASTATTFKWNGSAWSTVGNLIVNLNGAAGGGTASAGIIGGGSNNGSGTANQAASQLFASGPATVAFES